MKKSYVKFVYRILVPAVVALLAISCSASAVWGS